MSRTLSVTISERAFARLMADAIEEDVTVERQAALLTMASCQLLELTGAAHIDEVSPLALREAVDAAHSGEAPKCIAERNPSPVVRQGIPRPVRTNWLAVDAALDRAGIPTTGRRG